MKIGINGEIVHEDYTSAFKYKGRIFIVDKLDDGWLISESQMLIKRRGLLLDETITKIKSEWDSVEGEYSRF